MYLVIPVPFVFRTTVVYLLLLRNLMHVLCCPATIFYFEIWGLIFLIVAVSDDYLVGCRLTCSVQTGGCSCKGLRSCKILE